MLGREARRSGGARHARCIGERALVLVLVLALSACRHPTPTASRERRRVEVISVSEPTPLSTTGSHRLRSTLDLTCKTLAPNGCDVRDEVCQVRLFELACCLAARPGVRPPLRFISEADSRRVLLEHRARTHDARAGLAQALQVLGLGQAPTTEPLEAASGVGASAYYTPHERAVFFVTQAALPYDGELAALSLLHEYVHAIQDREGALLRAQNGRETQSFDEELTLWSGFEGEATLYEEVVRAFLHAREPATWVVARFAARTGGSDDAIVRQRRPLEASFATFPYSYGAYAAALETAPPLSTQALLARRYDWPAADAERCDDPSPPSLAGEPERPGRETLGAWLVQAYVRKASGDAARARSAAQHWRGDRLSFYGELPGGLSGFVWQSCWYSSAAVREMRELVATQLRAVTGASVTSDARRVTATVRLPQ